MGALQHVVGFWSFIASLRRFLGFCPSRLMPSKAVKECTSSLLTQCHKRHSPRECCGTFLPSGEKRKWVSFSAATCGGKSCSVCHSRWAAAPSFGLFHTANHLKASLGWLVRNTLPWGLKSLVTLSCRHVSAESWCGRVTPQRKSRGPHSSLWDAWAPRCWAAASSHQSAHALKVPNRVFCIWFLCFPKLETATERPTDRDLSSKRNS